MKKIINILILFFVFHLSSSAEYLDIPLCPQEKSNWCWAASTGAILLFYNTEGFTQENTQEKILNHVKGSLVNQGGTSQEMQKSLKMGKCSPEHLNSYSESNLIKDCDNGLSLMVNVKWNTSGAHATTYAGYQQDKELTTHKIMNPWPPNIGEWQFFTYESLQNWNGKGRWNYSLTTDIKTISNVIPCEGDVLETTKPYTIKWNSTSTQPVTIELFQGTTKVRTLGTNVPNNGSFICADSTLKTL